VHFEIPFDDGERASSFYADAFGWKLDAMPDMHYVLVTTGPSDEGPGVHLGGEVLGLDAVQAASYVVQQPVDGALA